MPDQASRICSVTRTSMVAPPRCLPTLKTWFDTRNGAVDRDRAADPVVAGAVLVEGSEVEGEIGARRLAAHREVRAGGLHLESSVRALGVIARDPDVEVLLRQLQRTRIPSGEELHPKSAVEALDLVGGGRGSRCGEAVDDAVLPADLVEEDLSGGETEATGEDLAVEFLSDVKPLAAS